MKIENYLFLDGRCDEAIAFYREALGAEVRMLMRFKESPTPESIPPGSAEKVMHSTLQIGESAVHASDGECNGQPGFKGFRLSLSVATDADAERYFGALSKGGAIQVPLAKTFFSSRFGMLTDRFGVSWMVMVAPTPPQNKP